jgi:hypothetical protein
LRSQARQFASKLATTLPSRTVTRCDGSQCIYSLPSLPSGTVTVTAAPLRAAMWRPPAETVGVVEHSPRSPRPWSCDINTVVGVTCSFYPHSAFFFLRSSASCASSPDRGTAKERRRRPAPRQRRRSTTPDIPADDAAAASSLHNVARRSNLPLYAHRRSIAAGQASVSSSSILPLSCLSAALYRYYCTLKSSAVSLPGIFLALISIAREALL